MVGERVRLANHAAQGTPPDRSREARRRGVLLRDEARLDVAPAGSGPPGDVGQRRFAPDLRQHRVHFRRARLHRLEGIEDGGKDLVFDLDQVDRLLRRHWLTIIEGRGRGLELILDQEWSTIGSHPSSTMLLSAPGVLAEHVGLKVGAAPVMRANGPVERNGALVAEAAEIALESGDVLRVGGSFIRFESRVGRTG